MAYSDRELLARIIKCEAGGEGEQGMTVQSYHHNFIIQISILVLVVLFLEILIINSLAF